MSTGPYGPAEGDHPAGPPEGGGDGVPGGGPYGGPYAAGAYGSGAYRSGGYPAGGYAPAPGYGAPPPSYPPPGYVPNAVTYGAYPAPRNGLGTAALVLGIIGVVFCWIPFTGWALNILAVIFGAIGRKRALAGEATNRSSAVAGLVLGVIGLAVWIVILVAGVAAFNSVRY